VPVELAAYNGRMSTRPPLVQPPPATTVAVLFQRLLARLDRPRLAAPSVRQSAKHASAPPGQRSGEGSESVLPYLAEDLQTRPGALD
jgi:hypothetical protein